MWLHAFGELAAVILFCHGIPQNDSRDSYAARLQLHMMFADRPKCP